MLASRHNIHLRKTVRFANHKCSTYARYLVLMALHMKTAVFRDLMPMQSTRKLTIYSHAEKSNTVQIQRKEEKKHSSQQTKWEMAAPWEKLDKENICLKIFFLLSFHQIFALPPSTTGLFAAMFSLLLSLHTYVPSFTHTSYSSTLKMDAACSS